jgi:hypothetical protein
MIARVPVMPRVVDTAMGEVAAGGPRRRNFRHGVDSDATESLLGQQLVGRRQYGQLGPLYPGIGTSFDLPLFSRLLAHFTPPCKRKDTVL